MYSYTMYALIDGNNFYVSCERAFNPRLKGRAVVVLSNNDGCVISRSEEAKAIVKMGQPYYQLQALVAAHDITALSANFALYGDISTRMMRLAAAFGPEQEIYSIDECFIGGLDGIAHLTQRAWAIRQRIERSLGIACGIGLGSSKTLAKLANHIAKRAERQAALGYSDALSIAMAPWARVCNWQEMSQAQQAALLRATPVGEVWGIGKRMAQRLATYQCTTAWDLAQMAAPQARRIGGVVLERTVRELQGISCLALDQLPGSKQQIASTHSFGHPVEQLAPLLEAVSTYASRAAEKARKAGQLARQVHVFAYTSPFRHGQPWHGTATVTLNEACNDSFSIVEAATRAARSFFQSGHKLSKAGVILLDLTPVTQSRSGDLFTPSTLSLAHQQLMPTLDAINQRFGKGTIHLASCGIPQDNPNNWRMKQAMLSPLYTMRLEDLPIAHA